jgi:hypothetical protein
MDDRGGIMEKRLVYFAHPMSHYDKEIEFDCLEFIWCALGENDLHRKVEIEIFNPNQLFVQRHVERLREEGEEYFDFFREIVKSCDIVVMTSFLDGKIGAGVAEEGTVGAKYGKKVFLLYFDEDGNKMFESVDPIDLDEITLTIEETRERIRKGTQ